MDMCYCCGSIEGFIWYVRSCNEITNSTFVPFHAVIFALIQTDVATEGSQFQLTILVKVTARNIHFVLILDKSSSVSLNEDACPMSTIINERLNLFLILKKNTQLFPGCIAMK